MKLVFDGEDSIKGHKYSNVIIIPTTTKEKEFLRFCKDINGNYKPGVYKALCDLGEQIIENPLADGYDEDGNLIYKSEALIKKVLDGDYTSIPKPSNFCILSLYYTLSKRFRKARQVKLLYEKKTDMFLNQPVVTIKVKE